MTPKEISDRFGKKERFLVIDANGTVVGAYSTSQQAFQMRMDNYVIVQVRQITSGAFPAL